MNSFRFVILFRFDESEKVTFFGLVCLLILYNILVQFRYSDTKDRIMLGIGLIFALAVGCSFPINLAIFSDVVNLLTVTSANSKIDLNSMRESVGWFCLLGSVTLILAFMEMYFFSLSARRQSRRIRLMLFKVIYFFTIFVLLCISVNIINLFQANSSTRCSMV